MDFPKKQQQCLIPRYLLQYLQDLQISHNDPTAPWGGGGGGSYTAGDGIDITNDVISIDNTVALKTDIPSLTGYATETWVTNQGYLVQSDLEDYITSTDLTAELLNYAELSDLATVATTGDYNDLLNKPTIPDAVSGTNDGTNWTSLTIGNATYGLASGSTPSNMVTTDTTQTITGTKTFQGTNYTTKINDTYNGIIVSDSTNTYTVKIGDNISFDSTSYYGNDMAMNASTMVVSNSSNTPNYNITLLGSGGATVGSYTFKNKTGDVAVTSEIPTATSDLTNDSGYITSSALIGYATESWVTNQGYSTFSGSYNDLTNKPNLATVATSGLYSDLSGTPSLATVATTGSYNDLSNKPTIPDSVSGTNDGTNWTSLTIGSDTYGIPSGGGSGSGPTITRYDTSSYMYYTNWTGSKTCTIYNGYPNSTEFRIENTNPGDILYFDITLSYYHFGGFMRSQRKLIKVVVPVKSTNTSYLPSHLDVSVSYEMFQTGATDLGNNFMTITIENITSASTNRVSMGELNVPLSWSTNTNNRITINAITHITF